MEKGIITLKETYAEAQIDTIIASPTSGKKFFIWNVFLEASSIVTVKFATSEKVIVSLFDAGSVGSSNLMEEGQVDEDIIITCPTGTKIIMLFDEL